MKSHEPLSRCITIIIGIVVVALMMALVRWSSSVFRNGVVV